MAHIVVLGGGIGGVSSAYDLKRAIRKDDRITLVSNKPFFQFTPSNPWVAVKWRTKNDVTIDLASVLPNMASPSAPPGHRAFIRTPIVSNSGTAHSSIMTTW